MAALYYDHLTLLPALGEPGAAPPITGRGLLAHVAGTAAEEPVAVVLLEDDLHLREGSSIPAEPPAVLTGAQLEGRDPLPYPLSLPDPGHLVPADGVWSAYYRHAAATADRGGYGFLGSWARAEVGLRNALATARARALGLDPGRYLVAPELAGGGWEAVVAEWASAADPLAGWQVLLRARWRWLRERDGWFTFSTDELTAYAAGLTLLRRWQRVLGARPRNPGEQA